MEDKRIPSMHLGIMLTQVEEMMGRRSLIKLLRQAGLSDYVDSVPSMDDTSSITVQEYAGLLAQLYDTFGARDARTIFRRGGRVAAAELRRQSPAQFAVTGTALKLLSSTRRMRIILDRLADLGRETYGAFHYLREDEDAFFLEIGGCPYCAEITRRSQAQNRAVTRPVCHIPVAIIDEMVEWATGERHLVEEVACIALGAPACRFRIGK
jgi:predicted hydrocarbon binding protein